MINVIQYSKQHHRVFYVACLATFLFGGLFQPGDWYQQLDRAPWNPPNIAFPIAWTILYVLIAISGHLSARSGDGFLIRLWFAQLLLNALWSWIFFGQHWVLLALFDLIVIVILVALFIWRSLSQNNTLSGVLMIPYFCWLCLATSLNAYIWVYN